MKQAGFLEEVWAAKDAQTSGTAKEPKRAQFDVCVATLLPELPFSFSPLKGLCFLA